MSYPFHSSDPIRKPLKAVQFAKLHNFKYVALDIHSELLDLVRSFPSHLAPDLTVNVASFSVEDIQRISSYFSSRRSNADTEGGIYPRNKLDAILICTASLERYTLVASLVSTHGVIVAIGQPTEDISFHWRTFHCEGR